jgi:chromosome segregation protein
LFKLKRIELLGFKSFADRTRLDFGEGIVAIVGPNGCGKSNVSDAITWVLGEQSARTLRGERMADVIFNGTSSRPATGMAEASLTLVDPEYVNPPVDAHHLRNSGVSDDGHSSAADDPYAESPAETAGSQNEGVRSESVDVARRIMLKHRSGEIVVTRRLFRSGESEYLINGESCRLRDIQDLFMGTGLGPESYAIIEQGRIGQILSSKPSDRRAVIEEAAGVSKFKTRKRLAEAKLESARQNLARINDILQEVVKQTGTLKRQASKARRFCELRDELHTQLRVVLAARLTTLTAECARLKDQLGDAQAEYRAAVDRADEFERREKSLRLIHDERERQLAGVRQAIAQRDLDHERLRSNMRQMGEQIATLAGREREGVAEAQELGLQVAGLEAQAAEAASLAEQVRLDWTSAKEAASQLERRRDEVALELGGRESDLEAARKQLLAIVGHAALLRNNLAKAEELGSALERQMSRIKSERAILEEEKVRLSGEWESFGDECRRDEQELQRLSTLMAETQSLLEAARSEESKQRSEAGKLRSELSAAAARKQALEETLARHAYSTETVRRLLANPIPINNHFFRPLGLLADFLEVSAGYEEVVEEFLQTELDYVVVEQTEEARSGIALLKKEGSGRSTFFVTRAAGKDDNGHGAGHSNGHGKVNGSSGEGLNVAEAVGVLAPLRDLVRLEPRLGLNGDPPLLSLDNTYLVEDAATAERMAAAYPDFHFLTRNGEHYHHRLVSGGRGKSAGPLALRRDFRALERRAAELEGAVNAADAALASAVENVAELEQSTRTLAATCAEAEKKAVLGTERRRQLRAALDRALERARVVDREAEVLQSDIEDTHARQAALSAQLEVVASEQAQHEADLSRKAEGIRELRTQIDALARSLVEVQARASTLEERLRSFEHERTQLAARLADVQSRLRRLSEQCTAWHGEQLRLGHEVEACGEALRAIESEQSAARAELLTLEKGSAALKAQHDELGPSIESSRAEVESLRERRSVTEIALARAESDYNHGAQQCRDELKVEPAGLLAECLDNGEALPCGEALGEAERLLDNIKTRIENLGPVNMMALEELQEAEERYVFLETQRQDLLASIEDTSQAIREIDQVSRRQFLDAFTAINGFFAESFRTLFGGGLGEMRLTDETDPDSGIDLAAQPPGKRLQNVLLLSGGEKALAAFALLIAMFRYTPSPFCVLDEVDAPLDESNVDRFTRLIRDMGRHTQFILITHNKRTMEIAKALYGVTMQEPGISRLVSVRFDDVAPPLVLQAV